MFSTLLESRRKRQRNLGATVVSSAFHVAIVVGAVYATAKGSEVEKEPEAVVRYTEVKRPDPTPPKPVDAAPPPDVVKAPLKGFQVLSHPIDIPKVLPPVNLGEPVTDVNLFRPIGKPGGNPYGTAEAVDSTRSYFIFEVEKVATLEPGNPAPAYPSILTKTGQTGKVSISFVIDTTGRADTSTVKVVESDNPLFTREVLKVLPKYKFLSAEIGGKKVRMQVVLPFVFKIEK